MQPALAQRSNRTRLRTLVLVAAAALAVALVAGGVAVAAGAHGGFFKRRLTQHIDAALDAVGASAQQRDAIHAARDHVLATMDAGRGAQKAELEQLLTWWQADTLDRAQLATLRAQHQAEAQKTADAVVQAIGDAHDALTTAQRQKLADYLRARKPAEHGGRGAHPMMARRLDQRVDELLEQIKATASQRDQVHAAVAKATASLASGDHAADFEQAVTLFTADRLDRAQVTALQAKHMSQLQQLGDGFIGALTEVHDVLDAGQRKQVADFVRAHHHGHGG